MKLYAKLLSAVAVFGAVATSAQADVAFTFTQSGNTVTMKSSGSLKTTNLIQTSANSWGGVGIEDNSGNDIDIMGDTSKGSLDVGYAFHAGTDFSPWIGTMFTKDTFGWSSTGTTQFATYLFSPNDVRIPGISLSSADIGSNKKWTPDVTWTTTGTFATIGLTAGTYSIVDSQTKETITIQVGEAAAVPEPASLAILGLGLVGIAAGRRRRA